MLLVEQANALSEDQYRAGVIEVFAMNSAILERLDFMELMGNAYKYNLEGALPGVAFRGVNQGYTSSVGVINPQVESLSISGGDLIIDQHLIRTRGTQIRSAHEAMKIKALAKEISKAFFDGNSATNPAEFDGLNVRLTGSQKILAGAGGAFLTQDMLDDLLAQVPNANLIATGTGGMQLITKLLRGNTQVSYDKDAFGRPVTMYAGIPIVNVGKDSVNTEILGFDEDPGDATLDTTSIYALRMGDANAETDLFGLQNMGGMIVSDLGEMESQPAVLTRVEWDVSLVLASSDCAGRLHGITNGIA